MRGSVLGYDAGAGVSVVRSEDGRRYAFAPSAWRESRPPRKGDLVDFEPRGDRAELVFLVPQGNEREKAAPHAGSLLMQLAQRPLARALLERPAVVMAALVLLAGLAEAYRFGAQAVSLYEVPDLIAGFARALDGTVGRDAGAQTPFVASLLRFALPLLLLLYAVPASAGYALWLEVSGRASGRVGRLAGLAAMLLPVLLPLLVVLPAQFALLPAVDGTVLRLGAGGVEVPRHAFDVLRLFGTGTVLVFAAGLGLWASAAGHLQPLRADRRGELGAGTALRGGPAAFGPPSVRKEGADEAAEMVLPNALQRRRGHQASHDDEAERPEPDATTPAAAPASPNPASRAAPREAEPTLRRGVEPAAAEPAGRERSRPPLPKGEGWSRPAADAGAPAAPPPQEAGETPDEAATGDAPAEVAERSYAGMLDVGRSAPYTAQTRRSRSFEDELEDPVLRRFVPERLAAQDEAAAPDEAGAERAPAENRGELSTLASDIRSALEQEIGRDSFRSRRVRETEEREAAPDGGAAEPRARRGASGSQSEAARTGRASKPRATGETDEAQ